MDDEEGDGGRLEAATCLAGDGGSVSTGEEPGACVGAGASAAAAKRLRASPTAARERKYAAASTKRQRG